MKPNVAKLVAPALLLGAMLSPLAAQAAPPFHHHGIYSRDRHQQERIYQGVRSGSLTHHEAYRLEHREARLDRNEWRDRRSWGHISPAEHARLEREENRDSHAIYRQKHDSQHR